MGLWIELGLLVFGKDPCQFLSMRSGFFSEPDILRSFIIGLFLPLCLVLEHLITIGTFFYQVVEHTRTIERACNGTYRGGDKRPCWQYKVSSILFRGRDPPSKSQHQLKTIGTYK